MSKLADKIANELKTAEAAVTSTWEAFDSKRTELTESGVDFDSDAGKAAFDELDQLGKSYDDAKMRAGRLKAQRDRIVTLENDEGSVDRFLLDPDGKTGHDGAAAKLWTPGERWTGTESYEALLKSNKLKSKDTPIGSTDPVEVMTRKEFVAALKTLVYTGAGGAAAGVIPDYQPGLIDLLRRTIRLLDLIPTTTTESDLVDYVQQTARTNAAAETAQASATNDGSGAAPESAVTLALLQTNVQDITHYFPVTRRALADAGQIAGLLDNELRAGVLERLETQILSGNGTAPNLKGILNTAGIGTQARGTDSRSDAIHKAITIERLAFIEPEAVVVHPTDYQTTVLEKDSTGNYIYGPPSQPNRGPIWGLMPIVTPAIAQGTALVANFTRGSQLFVREGLQVSASDSHSDFFIRRMVAMLAVMRVAFAVTRPAAFTTVTSM